MLCHHHYYWVGVMSLSAYRWQHSLQKVAVRKSCDTYYSSSVSPLRIYSEINLEGNQLRLDQWKSQITLTCSKSTMLVAGVLCPVVASSTPTPKYIHMFQDVSRKVSGKSNKFCQMALDYTTLLLVRGWILGGPWREG